jgi:aminomuconate-semialdehyde/2-hydroxymuconate-6-semialdehyde dehydrogenase
MAHDSREQLCSRALLGEDQLTMQRQGNCINGEVVATRADEWLDNVNPATQQVVSQIARSRAEDVDAAVAAAKAAAVGPWSQASASERADMLDRIADGIEARLDELAQLESEDTGKPVGLARTVDIPRAVANFRFFAGAVRHDHTGCHTMDGAINYTLRKSAGVCALITPWNLPLYLLTWKAAPALAMGNTIVAKPSEMTPRTASALAEIVHEAGLPPGVFNLIHGLGPECGGPLTGHPDVDLVSFTGGTSTGRLVAAAAAPQFKKLSLELGGKNATIVFADCDLEATAAGAARAAFLNQGQVCLCGSRILVERSIYEPFREALISAAQKMRPGDPADPETRMGALIGMNHRDKVESYVALAQEEGGTILCGGARPELPAPLDEGAFYQPTLVDGLEIDSRTATEEIFGPVATMHPFDTEEEAVEMANSVRYGLAGSVWTRDLSRAHRVAEAVDSGMVWVNTWLLRDLRVPFGGMKESGVGREGGFRSLEFFSEARNICIKL